MDKFTFKMKDRKKLIVERSGGNSCTLTVSGKEDTTFRFGKKRAEDLVGCLNKAITYGVDDKFIFNKSSKSPAGYLTLKPPISCMVDKDNYSLMIFERDKKLILCELGMSRKQIKKMIKVMKEVYGYV